MNVFRQSLILLGVLLVATLVAAGGQGPLLMRRSGIIYRVLPQA